MKCNLKKKYLEISVYEKRECLSEQHETMQRTVRESEIAGFWRNPKRNKIW